MNGVEIVKREARTLFENFFLLLGGALIFGMLLGSLCAALAIPALALETAPLLTPLALIVAIFMGLIGFRCIDLLGWYIDTVEDYKHGRG